MKIGYQLTGANGTRPEASAFADSLRDMAGCIRVGVKSDYPTGYHGYAVFAGSCGAVIPDGARPVVLVGADEAAADDGAEMERSERAHFDSFGAHIDGFDGGDGIG